MPVLPRAPRRRALHLFTVEHRGDRSVPAAAHVVSEDAPQVKGRLLPATPRSSRCTHRPAANQTPIGPRRPDQRVRARSLKPQLSAHSQVLEPCRVGAVVGSKVRAGPRPCSHYRGKSMVASIDPRQYSRCHSIEVHRAGFLRRHQSQHDRPPTYVDFAYMVFTVGMT